MASSATLVPTVLLLLLLVESGSATIAVGGKASESPAEAIAKVKDVLKTHIRNTHDFPGFEFKLLYGLGQFQVEKGLLSRMKSIEFLGEPKVTTENVREGDKRITMEFKFNDLIVQYKILTVSTFGVEVNGFWATKTVGNKVVVELVRGLTVCSMKVDSVQVKELTGLELVPNAYCGICERAFNQVTSQFKEYYTGLIEEDVINGLKKLVKEALETCDEASAQKKD